jgi:8-amino-7-oxononanoate synthase
LLISQQLKHLGILVTAIRPPTVPLGTSRLRITFSASHSIDHVDQLLTALKTVMTSIALSANNSMEPYS